jgi:hypothetical protein
MEKTTLEGIKPETLELEWLAEYTDDSALRQNYQREDEHHFGHIDQDKLSVFWLIDSATGEKLFGVDVHEQTILVGDVPFIVEFPRTKAGEPVKGKLVYFRRVRNDFAPEGITTTVRYAIGLQANIDGRNHQQYLFINMDGTFTLSQQK